GVRPIRPPIILLLQLDRPCGGLSGDARQASLPQARPQRCDSDHKIHDLHLRRGGCGGEGTATIGQRGWLFVACPPHRAINTPQIPPPPPAPSPRPPRHPPRPPAAFPPPARAV